MAQGLILNIHIYTDDLRKKSEICDCICNISNKYFAVEHNNERVDTISFIGLCCDILVKVGNPRFIQRSEADIIFYDIDMKESELSYFERQKPFLRRFVSDIVQFAHCHYKPVDLSQLI